jgi:hypothetical protein
VSLSVTALRQPRALFRRPDAAPLDPVAVRERTVRRRLNLTLGLLFLNTLTYISGMSILHIPSAAGKGIAQISLPLAVLVALSVNPRVRVRPNVFLCLVSLLVVDTLITAADAQYFGTIYRTVRLAEFVAVLWLLTPWWGRRDMMLLKLYLRWLWIALGTVVVGLLIAPGKALGLNQGRLDGVIWPMVSTQIAQYSAVAAGLMIVLWLARQISGRITAGGVAVAVVILLLTHTRTALAGLVAGLLVAGLSLFTINARVRKFFAAGVAVVSIGVLTVAGVVTTWLARGESTQGLTTLTGRTNFWALVVNEPRTGFEEIFGFGLSNASINGLPIDSNWFASYMMEGLVGVGLCAMIGLWLFIYAFFQPRGLHRALGLFLVTYCLLASFTEVGFTDANGYLINVSLAASLLVTARSRRQTE